MFTQQRTLAVVMIYGTQQNAQFQRKNFQNFSTTDLEACLRRKILRLMTLFLIDIISHV